ncbi:efflux RND transporter periplasmic adaptor subunit [Gynuella sp.]|uniref:efflux RND transporter periplasmic adaptor subunit n=1 Tax=Gynuella sp. TaxID=2969146 RepID=UPI003D0CF074
MKKTWLISSVVVIAALAGGYWKITSGQQVDHSLPVIKATKGTIEKQALAVGQIVPVHSVAIKSQIEGIVGRIYHQEGEQVTAGTALIKITPNPTPQALTDASTALMQSEASLESARQTLANLQSLVDQKIIPPNYSEYVDARSTVKSRLADVRQKQQNLDLIKSGEASVGDSRLTSTIVAPVDGTILDLKVDVGEPIISTASSQAATEMMTIANMQSMIFKGTVSEHDAARLKPGMDVTLTLAPYPEQTVTGVLSKVAVQSAKLNGTATDSRFDNGFEVEVDQIHFPADIGLRSGFSATARITLEKADNVVTIPERTLSFAGDQPQVLIPSADGITSTPRDVTLGLSDGIQVEVVSGLSEGESVVDNSQMGGVDVP